MHDLLQPLLSLVIIIMSLGVMFRFPVDRMLKAVGKFGFLLFIIGVIAAMLPMLREHLQNNPPQSLRELAIWLGVAFALLLICFRAVFGRGAVARLFEKLIASAVYDVLKSLSKLFFLGSWRLVGLLFRWMR